MHVVEGGPCGIAVRSGEGIVFGFVEGLLVAGTRNVKTKRENRGNRTARPNASE